ncbi:MAG: acyl-CoA dehydrogenase family protein [Deltaproteobacteria bacterium]|nr:acyl-CoA dehydrogenase family protein [Deltaproteobacteria bacterium]
MDFDYTPEEQRFRKQVRAWLGWHQPRRRARLEPGALTDDAEWQRLVDWHKTLYAGGWIGLSWPKEYGGRGATLMEQIIFNQELGRRKLPAGCNVLGVMMAGPAIMHWGTEEQKQRHLRNILSGDEIWCEGLSEPGSGSDLASLQCRAIPDGDDFVVNGQKVWTTLAHRSRWIQLFVRTDTEAIQHQGLSCLLVDVQSPGVTVRPLRQITGEAEFNEIFFEDVRVPKANLLGPLNAGWQVLITTLMHERAGIGELGSEQIIDHLLELARRVRRDGRPASKDGYVRQQLAQFAIEVQARKLNGLRSLTKRLKGAPPGPEGSIGKLAATELTQRMARFAVELAGPQALVEKDSPFALDRGRWLQSILRSPALTIAGGTSEVNRNIIAERILGLPK